MAGEWQIVLFENVKLQYKAWYKEAKEKGKKRAKNPGIDQAGVRCQDLVHCSKEAVEDIW